MTDTDIYIEKYVQLENAVRETFRLGDGDSISYYLTNEKKYKKYRADIKYCQDVHNWLHHNKKGKWRFRDNTKFGNDRVY